MRKLANPVRWFAYPLSATAIAIGASMVCQGISAPHQVGFVLRNAVFVAAMFVVTAPARTAVKSGLGRPTTRGACRAALCGGLAVAMHPTLYLEGSAVVTSLVLAATVEELVFRSWIPSAVVGVTGAASSSGWVFACAIAQVAFAASHESVRHAPTVTSMLLSACTLFVLGTHLCCVTWRCGIETGIVVHAALNLEVRQSGVVFVALDGPTVLVSSAVGLCALAYAIRSRPKRFDVGQSVMVP